MYKKSQTATEYLIILAVVIVIALVVVNTMGGFPGIGAGSSKKVSDVKLATDTVGIDSYSIGASSSIFKLKNNNYETITVNEFRLNQQINLTCNSSNTIPALPIVLNIGQTQIINCTAVNSSNYVITNKQTPLIGILYTDSISSSRLAGNVESYGGVSLSSNLPENEVDNNCHATGGNITIVGDYKIHTFTDDGILNIISGICNVDVIVVAGGGGGAGWHGGGGGGGGVVYKPLLEMSASNTSIVVGVGGIAGPPDGTGTNGGDSSFGSVVATGGGGAGGGIWINGLNGGSGGGTSNGMTPGSGTLYQGTAGGGGDYYSGGGGGGASTPGSDGSGTTGGNGGEGYSSIISGSLYKYGGGGGGGAETADSVGGLGGGSGGGYGGSNSVGAGAFGVDNSGGGGGGGPWTGEIWQGGNGGSGVVIVKYSLSGTSVIDCVVGQIGCSGTNYLVCTEGNWVDNGQVSGQCDYAAPGNITELRQGLVGYWPLDSNTNDNSGNFNNGVNYGAVPVAGKVGSGAYSFDGTTQYIAGSDASLPMGDAPRSVSFWFNMLDDNADNWMNIISYGSAGTYYGLLDFAFDGRIGSSGYNQLRITDWGADFDSYQQIDVNTWYHVVLTYDGANWKFYINNVMTDSYVYEYTVSSEFRLGGYAAGEVEGSSDFMGTIDEFAVWDRALSSLEVTQLYNASTGFSLALPADQLPECAEATTDCNETEYLVCTNGHWVNNGNVSGECLYAPPGDITSLRTGLVGYWPFDETSGTIAYDNSSSKKNGTLLNGVVVNQVGKVGKAYSFDGSDDIINVGAFDSYLVGKDHMTYSMWVNLDTYGAQSRAVMSNTQDGQAQTEFSVYSGGFNYCLFTAGSPNGWCPTSVNQALGLNSWHFLTFVYNGAQTIFYIDGVNSGEYSVGGLTARQGGSARNLIIGGRDTDYWNLHRWDGLIDEVAIWNRSLNSTEILQLYNSNNGMSLVQ